jgi:hypothetical protein
MTPGYIPYGSRNSTARKLEHRRCDLRWSMPGGLEDSSSQQQVHGISGIQWWVAQWFSRKLAIAGNKSRGTCVLLYAFRPNSTSFGVTSLEHPAYACMVITVTPSRYRCPPYPNVVWYLMCRTREEWRIPYCYLGANDWHGWAALDTWTC